MSATVHFDGKLVAGTMALESPVGGCAGSQDGTVGMNYRRTQDGSVRQWGDVSADGGKIGAPSFDLTYKPSHQRWSRAASTTPTASPVMAEGASGSGDSVTTSDDAPADAVLAAIAKASHDPLEIRDKDGVVCTRRRRPTQNKQGNVWLSVRVSATEWITKLSQVDEQDLIEPPFALFAYIEVYKRSALEIYDVDLAAQPGTLAVTLTPALRTLCASFPSLHAVRPDELQEKPSFGDANTQPPAPRPTNLAIGTPTADGR
jgi:predicted nucleic acid-binding protein